MILCENTRSLKRQKGRVMADEQNPMKDWKVAYECFTDLSPEEQELFLKACAVYQEQEGRADLILGSARQREDQRVIPPFEVEPLGDGVALIHIESPDFPTDLTRFSGVAQAEQAGKPDGTITPQERIREMSRLFDEWDKASPEERRAYTNACARACSSGHRIDALPMCRPDDDPNYKR